MASVQDVQALVERWKRIAVACGDYGEVYRGGGGNHGRKVTPIGQFLAILSQGPTSVSQIKALHGLAKSIENCLRDE